LLLSFVCILYIVFACLFKLFVCIFNFSLPLVVNKDVQYSYIAKTVEVGGKLVIYNVSQKIRLA